MLDKDDEENGGAKGAGAAKQQVSAEVSGNIDEDEMLDIAEKCFMRIADAIIQKNISVREAFKKHISKEIAQTEGSDGGV